MPPIQRCDLSEHQITRRALLAGTIGALGVSSLGQPILADKLAKSRKQLLLIFLSGGASQFETWDPKPGTETGGPFLAIPTSVPGTHISELLPHTSKLVDQLAIVRSIKTKIADHFLGHYVVQSGRRVPGYPELGSVAARLLEQAGDALPGYVSLRRKAPQAYTDVGNAGFLGARYEAIQVIDGVPPDYLKRPDSVKPESQRIVDKLRRRANSRFLKGRNTRPVDAYGTTFEQAHKLMKQRDIFDLSKESVRDRERYGSHHFGRHCLLARRLLENGISCVRVVHHDWDGHEENFSWHQQRCGEFDATFATLLADLIERGMLNDTLVVVMGEMGRTPRINHRGGRDHWGTAWSMAMAGCGIKQGVLFGQTNKKGTDVVDSPVDAGHLFHTFLKALGLDPTKTHSEGGRENPIGNPAAHAIKEVLV